MRLFLDTNVWTNGLGFHRRGEHPEQAIELIDKIKDASRRGNDIEVIVTRFQKDELISIIKKGYPLSDYKKKRERRKMIVNFNKHFEGCIEGVVQLLDNLLDPTNAGEIFNKCSESNRALNTPGYADLLLYEFGKLLSIEYYISFDEEFRDYLKSKGEKTFSPEDFDLV